MTGAVIVMWDDMVVVGVKEVVSTLVYDVVTEAVPGTEPVPVRTEVSVVDTETEGVTGSVLVSVSDFDKLGLNVCEMVSVPQRSWGASGFRRWMVIRSLLIDARASS